MSTKQNGVTKRRKRMVDAMLKEVVSHNLSVPGKYAVTAAVVIVCPEGHEVDPADVTPLTNRLAEVVQGNVVVAGSTLMKSTGTDAA